MFARPTLVIVLVSALGSIALKYASPMLPKAHYSPGLLGGAVVAFVTYLLLHELPGPQRRALPLVCGLLGFFVGVASAASLPEYAWSAGFGTAWFPALLLFLAGFGNAQFGFELSRLENEIEDRANRPEVLARAIEIRDAAEKEGRRIDRHGKERPDDISDPRAVYAYAAQIAGYGHALDGRYKEAIDSLGPVPLNWMPGPMRLLMQSNLAFWNLCNDDVAAAQKVIDAADYKDSVPKARPMFRATKALVLVRNGKVDDALKVVGEEPGDGDEPERLRTRYSIVRAHVLFAAGRKDDARREVVSVLESSLGNEELRRWLPAGGPAKALIEEMMRDTPPKPAAHDDEDERGDRPQQHAS